MGFTPYKSFNIEGAYSSIPAAGRQGRKYQATDVPYVYYDTGSAWDPYLGSTPLAAPSASGWTNVDTSGKSSTHAAYGHGLSIYGSDFATAAEDWRLQYRTAPSTPYTIKAHILPINKPVANSSCGIGFRASGSGNVVFWNMYWNASVGLRMQIRQVTASGTGATPTWSGGTAPTDILGAYGTTLPANGGLWLSIGDDGSTNRTYGISTDGQTFYTIATQTRTTHITADQVTFQCGLGASLGGTGECRVILDSWA